MAFARPALSPAVTAFLARRGEGQGLLIDGEWSGEGGETFATLDPALGEQIGVLPRGGAAEIDAAVAAARRALKVWKCSAIDINSYQFKEEVGHCRVPKGYTKDKELANWVRNQRLEEANMRKGKKTRMTQERLQALQDIGFKWSAPTPSRKNKDNTAENAADTTNQQQPVAKTEGTDSDGPTKETETAPAEPPQECVEV